jgi:Holliday junction resolvase RusA-like endonuclease
MSRTTPKDKITISFMVPLLPPSLNVAFRMHWAKRKLLQKEWDYYIYKHWASLTKFTFFKPVKILYTLSFASRRNRDFDNYIGGTKFITDALKKTFIFRDDSGWLKKVEVEFTEGTPGTRITIEEAE